MVTRQELDKEKADNLLQGMLDPKKLFDMESEVSEEDSSPISDLKPDPPAKEKGYKMQPILLLLAFVSFLSLVTYTVHTTH